MGLGSPGERPGDPRHWGLGEVGLGLLLSNVLPAIAVSIALVATAYEDYDAFPMWLVALMTLPLQLGLGGTALLATHLRGTGIRDLVPVMRLGDIPRGLGIGIAAQFVLVPLITYPILWLFDISDDLVSEPARELTDRATGTSGVIALVITVVMLAPVAEELFFRGLLYGALRKRNNLASLFAGPNAPDGHWTADPQWNIGFAAVVSGLVFALVHLEPLLFPALFAFGALLAWLYERHGRLGPAVWAHVGFNGITVIALLS